MTMDTAHLPGSRKRVRRGGRPSVREAECLDAHLIDVSEKAFLAQGFGATSMDALAVAAGVSKRTIYHRYASKNALFEAVMERAIGRVLKGLGETPPGDTLQRRLEGLAIDLVERAVHPSLLALMRTVIAEATRFPDLAVLFDHRARLQTQAFVVGALAREVDRETLRLRYSIETGAEIFLNLTALHSNLRALLGSNPEMLQAEARAHASTTVAVFLAGCSLPPLSSAVVPFPLASSKPLPDIKRNDTV